MNEPHDRAASYSLSYGEGEETGVAGVFPLGTGYGGIFPGARRAIPCDLPLFVYLIG